MTFELQKKNSIFESIAMDRTGAALCPVRTWSSIVKRILRYPREIDDSSVNLVRTNRSYQQLTSRQIRIFFRGAFRSLGEQRISKEAEDVETHSIRSTFAMILLLKNVSISFIGMSTILLFLLLVFASYWAIYYIHHRRVVQGILDYITFILVVLLGILCSSNNNNPNTPLIQRARATGGDDARSQRGIPPARAVSSINFFLSFDCVFGLRRTDGF